MLNQSISRTISLQKILSQEGAEFTQAFIETFSCKKNPDIERFLHKNAVRFEQARIARTFLLINEQSTILAYFTLSFKSITTKANKTLLKKLTGGLTNDNQISAFLIAQIGKNSTLQQNNIHLSDILERAFFYLNLAQSAVGGRVAILECENNAKLISLYEQNGFKLIDTVDDKHQLKTLFIIPKMK